MIKLAISLLKNPALQSLIFEIAPGYIEISSSAHKKVNLPEVEKIRELVDPKTYRSTCDENNRVFIQSIKQPILAETLVSGDMFKLPGEKKFKEVVRVFQLKHDEKIPAQDRGKLIICHTGSKQMIIAKEQEIIIQPKDAKL